MISWLFSAGPGGAQGTSRDLAGAELLIWFAWLEKLKVSIFLVIILTVHSDVVSQDQAQPTLWHSVRGDTAKCP